MAQSLAERNLDTWRSLVDGSHDLLLDQAAAVDEATPAAIARLRKHGDADLVRAALELTSARNRAAAKFPNHRSLIADRSGVEQATSWRVAQHKARRFERADIDCIHDLCCGIGGDAMALAQVKPVIGVDVDPLRAWMTAQNARCESLAADVTELPLGEVQCFHIDPARRDEASGGKRLWKLADYIPGPAYLEQLASQCPLGAIKLGPGIDLNDLPNVGPGEIELISDRGRLVQAVLWTGGLARPDQMRTATLLDASDHYEIRGEADFPHLGPLGGFVHVIDPAIERLELFNALIETVGGPTAAAMLHVSLGLLTSDQPLQSPWLRSFVVLAEMPWRPARVADELKSHDAGVVEVKPRGVQLDTDQMQRRLRGNGARSLTVFVLRFDLNVRAIIAERIQPA